MRSDGVLARIYEVDRVEFNFLLVASNKIEGEIEATKYQVSGS